MDRLPVEIMQEIIEKVVFLDKPKKLYHLRCVSKTWMSIIDQFSRARLFKIWFYACLMEIPVRYLVNLVRGKYPQYASRDQKVFWKRARMVDVAIDAYRTWNSLVAILEPHVKTHHPTQQRYYIFSSVSHFIVPDTTQNYDGDYFAINCKGADPEQSRTLFGRWSNLAKPQWQLYITSRLFWLDVIQLIDGGFDNEQFCVRCTSVNPTKISKIFASFDDLTIIKYTINNPLLPSS